MVTLTGVPCKVKRLWPSESCFARLPPGTTWYFRTSVNKAKFMKHEKSLGFPKKNNNKGQNKVEIKTPPKLKKKRIFGIKHAAEKEVYVV